jgi:hypothetical protein
MIRDNKTEAEASSPIIMTLSKHLLTPTLFELRIHVDSQYIHTSFLTYSTIAHSYQHRCPSTPRAQRRLQLIVRRIQRVHLHTCPSRSRFHRFPILSIKVVNNISWYVGKGHLPASERSSRWSDTSLAFFMTVMIFSSQYLACSWRPSISSS